MTAPEITVTPIYGTYFAMSTNMNKMIGFDVSPMPSGINYYWNCHFEGTTDPCVGINSSNAMTFT